MRQVLRAGALARPRGMGWGGRQEGGSGSGTHVNPWLIHFNVRQKPLQYCKVIIIQIIKINEKNKKQKRNGLVLKLLSMCLKNDNDISIKSAQFLLRLKNTRKIMNGYMKLYDHKLLVMFSMILFYNTLHGSIKTTGA